MRRRRARHGYALVVVLWALVLIGAVAAEFHAAARADRRVTANLRAATAAKWAARAGVARVTALLDRHTAVPGAALALAGAGDSVLPDLDLDVGGIRVRVRVRDARARINLRRTDGAALARLLRALDVPEPRAASLAGRIMERADDLLDPADLYAVDGVTADDVRRMAPHLTTAGDGRINVNSAPAAVLQTLPAIDPAAARAIVDRRRRTPLRSTFDLLDALPRNRRQLVVGVLDRLEDRIAFNPREVEIVSTAAAAAAGGVRAEVRAVFRLSGGDRVAPVRIVER